MNLTECLAFYRAMQSSLSAEGVAEFRAMSAKDRDELLLHMVQHITLAVEELDARTGLNGAHDLSTGMPPLRSDS